MEERTIIIVNGKKMHLIIGVNPNTIENNENLWDISFEDFLTNAVEVNEDIWYIYFNGRCYESVINYYGEGFFEDFMED